MQNTSLKALQQLVSIITFGVEMAVILGTSLYSESMFHLTFCHQNIFTAYTKTLQVVQLRLTSIRQKFEVNFYKTEVLTVLQFGGGIMGPPGPPGVCSCNLTTFLNSLSLQDAIPGPPGVPGIDGKAGPPGTSVSQHL